MTRGVSTGHRHLDHTADLALALWAPTESALLAEGARAVTEILTQGAQVHARAERRVHLDAIDGDDRLVQWLNEIVFLAVTDGFVYHSAQIALRAGGLDADVAGQPDSRALVVTELKSATYHDLSVTRRDGLWRARVVIDV